MHHALRSEPPLDPDADEARRLLQEELDRGPYVLQESFVSRAWRWFTDLLPDLSLPGQLPGWFAWAVVAVVLLAVASVLAFALRDRWRTGRLAEPGTGSGVLEGERRSADDHRASARRALEHGEHDTALLEAYRALTVRAIERTVLDDRPGTTAHEVAVRLGPVFPGARDELDRAADLFDTVRYGRQRASADQAGAVLALDDRLAATRPDLAAARSGS